MLSAAMFSFSQDARHATATLMQACMHQVKALSWNSTPRGPSSRWRAVPAENRHHLWGVVVTAVDGGCSAGRTDVRTVLKVMGGRDGSHPQPRLGGVGVVELVTSS